MERSDDLLKSTENDDNESTDSSMCIINAEELDEGVKENETTFILGGGNGPPENNEIQTEKEQNQNDQAEGTEDSFSAMTQSQYAQV